MKWFSIPIHDLKISIYSQIFRSNYLIDFVDKSDNWICKLPVRILDTEFFVDFNLYELFKVLGNVANVLYRKNDFDILKNVIKKYYSYTNEDLIVEIDFLKNVDDIFILRVQYKNNVSTSFNLQSLINELDLKKIVNVFNRVNIGSDRKNLEFQFLSSISKTEVRPGDFLEPGIFVKFNGKVEVSPGVNRLVCSNGMIDRLSIWNGLNFDFLYDYDFIQRSISLMKWMIERSKIKISKIREISIVLGQVYKANFLQKFWKSWSERIELGELTWYDVINDLTQSVNNTLGNMRYKVLQVYDEISKVESINHCPICSAKV